MKLQKLTNIILISTLVLTPIVYQTINISKTIAANNINNTKQNIRSQFKTYTLNRTISISYPSKWLFFKADDNYVYVTNKQPKFTEFWPYGFIKTDIAIEPASLKDRLKYYTSTNELVTGILKVENIRINNRDGYRILSTNGEINIISTIGYVSANRTVSINTFHNAKNTKILPTVYKIHNSLKVLK
ncbi:hypothetical protein VB711_24095 [Cronbergia sp. UHCC 0137]|uniref:hypothetical protein n=1 Tax=Cronbergia sp. UHCC 0137 TaxID=3110239 RepID=UPI002B21EB74|nr:hypothetical protein [Cronbergia sp. UHCC 0137]MEA5620894.1 hypothetical protein [Cronbergia sp. UHCC 0137]